MIEKISLKTYYQWFFLENLKHQIDFVVNNNIKKFNCVTEPIYTNDIVKMFFINNLNKCYGESLTNYNIKTKYYNTGYIDSKEKILKEMEFFINDFYNKSSLE